MIQQLALSTYESKDLEPHAALRDAKGCMNELSPHTTAAHPTLHVHTRPPHYPLADGSEEFTPVTPERAQRYRPPVLEGARF